MKLLLTDKIVVDIAMIASQHGVYPGRTHQRAVARLFARTNRSVVGGVKHMKPTDKNKHSPTKSPILHGTDNNKLSTIRTLDSDSQVQLGIDSYCTKFRRKRLDEF